MSDIRVFLRLGACLLVLNSFVSLNIGEHECNCYFISDPSALWVNLEHAT